MNSEQHLLRHTRQVSSRRPRHACYPTCMSVPLTGTDSNLMPLSKTLHKAGYRSVGQVEPVLPQRAVDSTPNFGNRPPLQPRPTMVQIALKTLEGLLRHCGNLALCIRIDLHTHRHSGSRSLMNRGVRVTPSGHPARRPRRTVRRVRVGVGEYSPLKE